MNGKPALCVELTEPDGAADLLGYGTGCDGRVKESTPQPSTFE